MTRIYVGNLNRLTTADQIHRLFQKHGSVRKAGLLRDTETGVSRGFGYVLMGDDLQATAAILKLHHMRIDGSVIVVKNALRTQLPLPNVNPSSRRRTCSAARFISTTRQSPSLMITPAGTWSSARSAAADFQPSREARHAAGPHS